MIVYACVRRPCRRTAGSGFRLDRVVAKEQPPPDHGAGQQLGERLAYRGQRVMGPVERWPDRSRAQDHSHDPADWECRNGEQIIQKNVRGR